MLHAQSREITGLKARLPQLKDSCRYIDTLNRIAGMYLSNQLDSSFVYVTKAQEMAERLKYARGKADATMNMGNYYALRSNSYLSYRCYLDALQAYEEMADSNNICVSLMNIGVFYKYDGQVKPAAYYISRAMKIATRLQKDLTYASVLTNYYVVHNGDSSRQDSLKWALASADSIASKYNDERSLLNLSLYNAYELLQEGNAAASEMALLATISKAEHNGYTYISMSACAYLAVFKAWLRQADSLQYKEEMVRYGMAGGYHELLLPTAVDLYNWYASRGNAAGAARYSSLLLKIIEKERSARTQGELDYLGYVMQGQRLRELQLQHRSQQQQLDKKRLENLHRQYFLGGMVLLLLMLAILLVFLLGAYNRSKGNAARLAEKYREISEKNALLKTHDDFKNKLISLIAHDFRSPLVHIKEITTFVKENAFTLEEAANMMVKVERSSRNTLHTFENILRWISSQLSGFVYAPEPCTTATLLEEAIDNLEDIINEKEVEIKIDIPRGLQVMAERQMLQFVHRNFIHNAVKFSPRGGIIYISAAVTGNEVKVTVTDQGPGIPEDILPQLFEYRSSDRPGRGKQQGAGLALIICKDFMQMMNGAVQAANTPGRGAALSYILPIANS
ncbi:MAG TPA: HAMP domain-containing sensor histidine kinase [Chitinophaga sp.]